MLTFRPQDFVILVIDDIAQNIQILVEFLEKEGYQTCFFRSGKEAVEKVKKIKPDLILLDLMMPEIDGLQVCERLKSEAETQDIPIIFLTASHEEDNLLTAFQLGAADYVTKPFTSAELLARVRTHLCLKQQAVKLEEKNHQLQQSEAKFNTIVTCLYDGILIVDKTGVIKFINPAGASMFNQPISKLLNQQLGIPIMVGETTEIDIFRAEGNMGVAEITMSETQWQGEEVYLVSLRDISHRRAAETAKREALETVEELKHQLNKLEITDPLTGVFNSAYILQLAEKEFQTSYQVKKIFSIGLLELDGFKQINRDYGYEIGNLVLKKISEKIRGSIKKFKACHCGRLGGSYFLILFPKLNEQEAKELRKEIRVNCENIFLKVAQKKIEIKLNWGEATYQEGDRQFQQILDRANAKLYQEKNKQKIKV